MTLDAHQQEKVLEWNARRPTILCPLCQANDWAVLDLVRPPTMSSAGVLFDNGNVPLLETACNACGNVLLFDAQIIGVWNPPG